MQHRIVFGLVVGTCLQSLSLAGNPQGIIKKQLPPRPNFLIIMADDCTYNDLPVYGGQNAWTPNLDRLAGQGLVFDQAYLGSAMCQPCRAELFSGLYPLSNGCCWNHSASRGTVRSLPHYLRPLGYRVGIAGKIHVKPKQAFPFDRVDGFDSSCVRNPTRPHDLAAVAKYMESRKQGQPFCLVIALVEPHIPWTMGDASRYPPQKIKLPPNLADTAETRKHYSDYLAEITYMDSQVGEILETLEKSGQRENTLVLFTSEQGSQFPGCKWTNWNTGVHTGLIACWPKQVAVGRTEALVQYADVVPTLLELAGGKPPSELDGFSFRGVLTGNGKSKRRYAYGMHNNLPEGPAYPIRSITDGKYRYIRNLRPDEIYIEKHLMSGGRMENPYWATWLGADPLRQPKVYELTRRYMRRPAEQLYWTQNDPYELENIADKPDYREIQKRMRLALDSWLESEADPGSDVDTPAALKAARQGKHLHGRQQN